MAKRIVIDPITRIEGHLRVEVDIQDGKIVDAYSSGTMVRGLELILKGRDPRDAWAFTERVCGVCTTVHALASVRTVENALDIVVPPNAELIRNLMFCSQYMHDHVVHFYHLHALDWVDVVSALKANPAEAKGVGLSEAPRGALAHWINIKEGAIDNYQLVVPSTWNASPRDTKDQKSAYEASLIGTPVADPENPLEILRTIHSFDPCIACAVHVYDEKGTYVHQIQTF